MASDRHLRELLLPSSDGDDETEQGGSSEDYIVLETDLKERKGSEQRLRRKKENEAKRLDSFRGRDDLETNAREIRRVQLVEKLGATQGPFAAHMAHQLFRCFDRNRDHSLTTAEFYNGLVTMKLFENAQPRCDTHLQKVELFDGIVKCISLDGTGHVTQSGFIEYMTGKSISQMVDEARSKSNSGYAMRNATRSAEATVNILDFGTGPDNFSEIQGLNVDNLLPILEEKRGYATPKRWIDIRGSTGMVLDILKSQYDLTSLTDVGISNAGKLELEPDEERYIAHSVCHIMTLRNCPLDRKRRKKRRDGSYRPALRDKNYLDMNPPDIEKQQLDMILIQNNKENAEDTLVTIGLNFNPLGKSDPRQGKDNKGLSLVPRKGISMAILEETMPADAPTHENNNGMQQVLDQNQIFIRKMHRKTSIQFLMWSILDSVIAELDFTRGELMEWANVLDDEITSKPKTKHVQHLHDLQTVLEKVIHTMTPLVRNLSKFEDDQSPLSQFFKGQLSNFRSSRDELAHILDDLLTLQKQRESLVDVYRQVKEEKSMVTLYLLTLVTTVFVPLQFFTGLWGMNFQSMPLIHWKYGYTFFWFLSAVIVFFSFVAMKKFGMLNMF
eukprot:m.74462 g.74462  ORF g.74462 m.74462 type:complete len:613 (+) comp12462_c0_seq2:231-2069(+)